MKNVYAKRDIDHLLDDDEISNAEAAFMTGYLEALD